MALLGIATIPLTYLAARVMFDSRRMALLSALVLAVMQWHLIFSRTAFIAVSWPLLEMITVLCLFLALKLRNQWWFASAGLALGLGVYTANVYPVFIVGVIFFVVLQMLQARPSRRGLMATGIAIMAVCTLITVLPMVRYATDHGDTFKQRTRPAGVNQESRVGRRKLPGPHEAGRRIDLGLRQADRLGQPAQPGRCLRPQAHGRLADAAAGWRRRRVLHQALVEARDAAAARHARW